MGLGLVRAVQRCINCFNGTLGSRAISILLFLALGSNLAPVALTNEEPHDCAVLHALGLVLPNPTVHCVPPSDHWFPMHGQLTATTVVKKKIPHHVAAHGSGQKVVTAH